MSAQPIVTEAHKALASAICPIGERTSLHKFREDWVESSAQLIAESESAALAKLLEELEIERVRLAEILNRLVEIKECAQAIHRNINEEHWTERKDPLWVPTIHAHATVILQECDRVFSTAPQPQPEQPKTP